MQCCGQRAAHGQISYSSNKLSTSNIPISCSGLRGAEEFRFFARRLPGSGSCDPAYSNIAQPSVEEGNGPFPLGMKPAALLNSVRNGGRWQN
jgi:hypothetical protein